jgi:hypothetical protein
MHNSVDNELGDPEKQDRQKRSEEARNQTENYDAGARIPNDFENSRNVAERRDALLPSGPVTLPLGHVVYRLEGFLGRQMITMQLGFVRPCAPSPATALKEDAETILKVYLHRQAAPEDRQS